MKREGRKDDWVVQTPCSHGKVLAGPAGSSGAEQNRWGLCTDQGWRTCLSLRSSVLDWHCLKVGGLCSELRRIFWTVAAGSGQLPALLHRSVGKGDLSTVPPLAPRVSNVSGTVCLFSLLLGLNVNLRKLPSLQIFCCYCL